MDKQLFEEFFVYFLNDIFKAESNEFKKAEYKKLSFKEIHLLQIVEKCEERNENTSKIISKNLGITQGSLTVAVKTLVKKEYLISEKDLTDKRMMRISTTEKAKDITRLHEKYHKLIVQKISLDLSDEEKIIITTLLDRIRINLKKNQ